MATETVQSWARIQILIKEKKEMEEKTSIFEIISLSSIIVVLALMAFLLFTGCSKKVNYTPQDGLPVNCVTPTNCHKPGGNKNQPAQPLEITVSLLTDISHNRLLCADVQLEDNPKVSLGCNNDGSATSITFTAPALKHPGDSAKLKIWYNYVGGNTSYSTKFKQHPGHFKLCQTTGPEVWVGFEDHLGIREDYNDSQISVESTTGEPLRLEVGLDGHLYVVWEN